MRIFTPPCTLSNATTLFQQQLICGTKFPSPQVNVVSYKCLRIRVALEHTTTLLPRGEGKGARSIARMLAKMVWECDIFSTVLSKIVDIRETANFDFPFPHASSYQAKSNLVLGDSQNAIMSTTVSSEACLLQGRLGEWVRESSQSNNNKFNDRGVLRNKFCTTEAGHIKSNDVLHLAYDGPVSENDCIIEHGVSNSKIDSNGSYDKLVSPVKGETSNLGYQFPFAASCQAKSSFLVLGNNDTDISKNQADSTENKGTGYGKSSSNVATNVSNTSNTVRASLSLLQFL